MKSILLVKKLLGLVEMMSGLVNASFSLSEWQEVKTVFFLHLGQGIQFYYFSSSTGCHFRQDIKKKV